ncbi:uncharacterized protein cd5 [Mastacembelus armatus]|uniref:uncharacterized protein cd5 n=1 Tax=Mastacembelus armatus TaxID=205130 RepID=UPI000E458B08|nr:uncharacterized protein LOC113128518 [Mastacembelus armatus]
MDLKTIVTFSALLLMAAGQTAFKPTSTETGRHNLTQMTSPTTATTRASSHTAKRSTSVIGFLSIKWKDKCDGDLMLYHHSNFSHVCHGSKTDSLLTNVCKNKKGCKEPVHRDKGVLHNGYHITDNGIQQKDSCMTLRVQCTVEVPPDVQCPLKAYKVATALLSCVLVVLFMIRFTRPTVKALQKRLSNRRQNRWIGPTQSHSVSYHRGKTAVKNNDGEKRLSYPALERLVVSDSREPSSNRSSAFNL